MRRYSWTKHTMIVAEVGGPYVTFHDHQRAMDAKDAEIAELRAKVDATSVTCSKYDPLGDVCLCKFCKDTGCSECY